jgi:hypothetical protein
MAKIALSRRLAMHAAMLPAQDSYGFRNGTANPQNELETKQTLADPRLH